MKRSQLHWSKGLSQSLVSGYDKDLKQLSHTGTLFFVPLAV
jgi:hypothetical protein